MSGPNAFPVAFARRGASGNVTLSPFAGEDSRGEEDSGIFIPMTMIVVNGWRYARVRSSLGLRSIEILNGEVRSRWLKGRRAHADASVRERVYDSADINW